MFKKNKHTPSCLDQVIGSNPVQPNNIQYEEQNRLLGTALYTNTQVCSTDIPMYRTRKRAETNSSEATERLLFFQLTFFFLFFPS